MRPIWISLMAAAMLSACAGSPPDEQAGASVEDRKPGPVAGTGAGAQIKPVPQGQIARVDLTKPKPPAGYSVLKDPNNILSKRSVYFDLDSFAVKDGDKGLIEAHARYLRANPAAKMLIQGNTDERGSREYNLALGQKRADAMKKMLTLLGAKEEQVEAVSLGEEKPRAQGSTEEAYVQNRRGDMLYAGEY
ncbi:MAG: peptidoglycan-associated lipoprotein Pal [Betaproteobacteria bacterium]|nr:peptidoglycan-associated lipoprotein Pal [Betaproteobacteria bacterium]